MASIAIVALSLLATALLIALAARASHRRAGCPPPPSRSELTPRPEEPLESE